LPDGLEHSVPTYRSVELQEALVDETAQRSDYRHRVDVAPVGSDLHGPLKWERRPEHCEGRKYRRLNFIEQIDAPGDRRGERLGESEDRSGSLVQQPHRIVRAR